MVEISDEWFGRIFSLPGLIGIFILVIFPTAMLFRLSFLQYDFINPVKFVGLKNYKLILNERLLTLSLRKTVIYTVGVTTLALALSTTISASLARMGQRRFSTVYRVAAILPFAVPLVLSGLVWRWLLDPALGLLNYTLMVLTPLSHPLNIFGSGNLAMISVILADAWVKIPFMMIFILSSMEAIDQDLYDAAEVDGANCIDTFRNITIPLSKTGILYSVFITSLFSFRTISAIWPMTRGGPGRATYHIGIYLIDNITRLMNLGQASVIGIIVFVILSGWGAFIFYNILKS